MILVLLIISFFLILIGASRNQIGALAAEMTRYLLKRTMALSGAPKMLASKRR
jgi:hypothetical protein